MSKRLITDRDVLEGRCGARIVLDGETLLTPSARDRAMRLGIKVVEDGEHREAGGGHTAGEPVRGAGCARCGAAKCSGQCASCAPGASAGSPLTAGGALGRPAGPIGSGGCSTCGNAAGGLPDGLYLVRIEGGRAVSTLPAAGAGLMPRAHSTHATRS